MTSPTSSGLLVQSVFMQKLSLQPRKDASELLQEGVDGQNSGKDGSGCSLLPDGDIVTFSPGYAAITGSRERGPAQHLALGTVSRADNPVA